MRGDGTVYLKDGRYWLEYYVRGECVREPGGLDGRGAKTEPEARKLLKRRLKEIHGDRYVGPREEKRTVLELLDSYVEHLTRRGAKSVPQVASHLKPVRAFFSFARAVDVTTDRIREFIEARSAVVDGPTVNRSLQALRAAFNLARKEGRFSRVPYFPLLPEDNTRRGFFEREEHEAIKARLGNPYADIAEFGYRTGWRRGEIEPLQWKDVDREAGTASLLKSKNGEPRTFPFRDDSGNLTELGELIERRWTLRVYQTKNGPAVSPFVFHRSGRRVWTFDDKWREAAKAANLPGRLFHDYRRTAVRDLVRAGVSARA